MFTDGLAEASASNGEEFGDERLVVCASTLRGQSSADFSSALLTSVKEFCASPLADDATLIVVTARARPRGPYSESAEPPV
jgi:serine phosphatase RsbU (regulator of sigma subunit)